MRQPRVFGSADNVTDLPRLGAPQQGEVITPPANPEWGHSNRGAPIIDDGRLSSEELAHVATHAHGMWKGLAIGGCIGAVFLGVLIGFSIGVNANLSTTQAAAFDARIWACTISGDCERAEDVKARAMTDGVVFDESGVPVTSPPPHKGRRVPKSAQ